MRPLAFVPPALAELTATLAALPMTPLVVRCEEPQGYLPPEADGALHLDSLLAHAVVKAWTGPPIQWSAAQANVVPVPLACLWVSPHGLPLWASTPLVPHDLAVWASHWHKRYPSDRAHWGKRQVANLSAGRWKEFRVPIRRHGASALTALCVGHAPTITRLLEQLAFVGKRPAAGYGRVRRWVVEEWPEPPANPLALIAAQRPVPVAYLTERGEDWSLDRARHAGWTPPYWERRWHETIIEPIVDAVAVAE